MSRLTLKDISENVFLSPYHLCRAFKKYTKINLFGFLNTVRLDKSLELLKDSNKSISEIASETGFSSVNYFSLQFKSHLGMTPKDYRKTVFKRSIDPDNFAEHLINNQIDIDSLS